VNVNDYSIKELIEGKKQFEVPIWQRQYTWRASQHEQLWSDLREQYGQLSRGQQSSGHFFGSVVLAPSGPTASGVSRFLIIDGQQRLTTLMLLLCALRDAAAENDEQAIERYNDDYLLNRHAEGEERFRLMPTTADRAPFKRWVRGEADNGSRDLISNAYRFYRQQVGELEGDPTFNLELLTSAALESLEIVEITTQHGDNVHRIFQSLNGTGVRLSQADLLRNHLFMLLPTRGNEVYADVWQPMEAEIDVANLEGLARLDLLRRGSMVSRDKVYEEQARLLTPLAGDETAVEDRIRDLALRASFYKRLIDPHSEPHAPTQAVFQRLARWGAQTSYPVLMMGLDLRHQGLISDEEMAQTAELIESFLVRRQLARIPTNALNRTFVALIPRLPADDRFVEAVHYELSRDRLYWQSDAAVRDALRRVPFFHVGRGYQRKMILEQLERSFGHPEVVDFEKVGLQEEHVMPQTLSPEWRGHLEALSQDPDAVHDTLVHTLGNMTLTAFNGTLSNNPFERKAQIYSDSHLELNRALAENEAWGEDQILARAELLAEQVAKIWPAPIPGVTSESSDGFDWSRIEAAIEAIAPGRWTSYGDLAELGGTAPVPVGSYISGLAPGTNAYRVLTSEGSVSGKFHWEDPDDTRDVREVLAAEGISFEDNRADPEQRLSAEELAALIDEPEEQVGEDTGLDGDSAAA
jgi:alkylated DNA nucleotide flippase Atl1